MSALLAAVREAHDAAESIAAMARDEATGAEAKAEGKYDTRATEASYLARGQARRIAELRRLVAWLDRSRQVRAPDRSVVTTGAVIAVVSKRGSRLFFMAPAGGYKVQTHGQSVSVISAGSPIGEAMLGLEVGDAFEVVQPRGSTEYEIIAIR